MEPAMIRTAVICGAVLLLLLLITLGIVRRAKSKRKVRRMEMSQKIQLLNELAEPFGFFYKGDEDVFTSRQDAWQREMGYEALYDRAASAANMVIDAWPVYFDYEGRTWLIEFWKGQYGINTGGEVGVYHAGEIVPPHLYQTMHFEAAENDEIPQICCYLERKEQKVYEFCERHWWLTGFRMGTFSRPSELRMMTPLTFEKAAMAQAFFEGLLKTGQPRNKFRICGNEVYVRMDFSRRAALLQRLHGALVQCGNRCYCQLYRMLTRPFTATADRMLFLYYQVPGCFRRMMRLGRDRYGKDRKKNYCGSCGKKQAGCCGKGRKKKDGVS